ncbi:MAG: hypothetical protein JW822_04660 [Spirochaetales bacterium]|nr:hypothetical protein [Spirochaetales bacterium]
MTRIALIIISCTLLLFSGCIGIESSMKINENGSGTVLLKYKVSQLLVSMGQTETEGEKQVPLPLTEEDFRQTIEKAPGLTLLSINQEETESDVLIRAEIAFTDMESLSKSEVFADMPISFRNNGNNYIFSQLLTEGSEEMTEEQRQAMEDFFQGYELAFIITAPRKIVNYNRGELSQDQRTLTYNITMLQLLELTERTELTLSW